MTRCIRPTRGRLLRLIPSWSLSRPSRKPGCPPTERHAADEKLHSYLLQYSLNASDFHRPIACTTAGSTPVIRRCVVPPI
ncbi:unnamed protein product, partial [Mycena citricolor]